MLYRLRQAALVVSMLSWLGGPALAERVVVDHLEGHEEGHAGGRTSRSRPALNELEIRARGLAELPGQLTEKTVTLRRTRSGILEATVRGPHESRQIIRFHPNGQLLDQGSPETPGGNRSNHRAAVSDERSVPQDIRARALQAFNLEAATDVKVTGRQAHPGADVLVRVSGVKDGSLYQQDMTFHATGGLKSQGVSLKIGEARR